MGFLRQICGLLVFMLMMNLAQSVFAGYVARNPVSVDAGLSPREQAEQRALIEQNRAELIGVVAGYVLSGGNPDNVNAAATTAKSGLANNRQLHIAEIELIELYAAAFAVDVGLCSSAEACSATDVERARAILAANAYSAVDEVADGLTLRTFGYEDQAVAFLDALRETPEAQELARSMGMPSEQTLFREERGSALYRNQTVNIASLGAADVLISAMAAHGLTHDRIDLARPGFATVMLGEALVDYGDYGSAEIDAWARENPDQVAEMLGTFAREERLFRESSGLGEGLLLQTAITGLLNAVPDDRKIETAVAYYEGRFDIEVTPDMLEELEDRAALAGLGESLTLAVMAGMEGYLEGQGLGAVRSGQNSGGQAPQGGGATNNGASYPNLARPTASTPANTILGDLDELGRPTGVVSTITPNSLGTGTPADPSIKPPGFEGAGSNHARGHLLARMLGGAGDDARNIVTLFQRNANHPNMSSFERQVQAAVRNGETVSFRAIPIYSGNNPMPTGVTLTARGSNGFDLDVSIPNVNGLQ